MVQVEKESRISVMFKYTMASAMFFCLAGIVFFAIALVLSMDLPEMKDIKALPVENGVAVELAEMPGNFVNSVITAFDPEYYKHYGIKLSGLSSVFSSGSGYCGKFNGSMTISQNLSSYVLSRHKSKISFDGVPGRIVDTVKMLLLTLKIEFKLKKDKTLEAFLNTARFGNNVNGLFQASATYYNKKPSELSLAECASLAVLMSDPDGLDPFGNPDGLMHKTNELLEKMKIIGFVSSSSVSK